MVLDVYFEDQHYRLDVPKAIIESGRQFFDRMDRDMDAGWQMGHQFVERPDEVDRGRIAASRLLIALEKNNESMIQAMAGYILSRLPGTRAVHIDTKGEMMNTQIIMGDEHAL